MNNNIAILEVRGATGGDEAKIWAVDLIRMYTRFAESQNWRVSVLDEGVLRIKGENVYKKLKKEAGVHRVQRIPTTERHGRIHTSTATVAVLPEVEAYDIQLNPQDLTWEFFRSGGKGGQNVNKVSTAVRLKHKPTGLVVEAQQERTQEQNRRIAQSLLCAKLWEIEQEKKSDTLASARSAVGRGMRAEKIRTYNYSQNRVTDHRIGKKFRLEDIIDGKLEKLLKKLSA